MQIQIKELRESFDSQDRLSNSVDESMINTESVDPSVTATAQQHAVRNEEMKVLEESIETCKTDYERMKSKIN